MSAHVTAELANADGQAVRIPTGLDPSESILAQVGDPKTFPELWLLREHMRTWRFYHHFDTSPTAPARHPQSGVRTRVLDDRGDNLAAALATIRELGDNRLLQSVVAEAFPGSELFIEAHDGRFAVNVTQRGLLRPLTGVELSDGTLRFLCLTAALLTTQAPGLMVLNEPETSLHSQLLAPLARLIKDMSARTQVWVSTHSPELAGSSRRLRTRASSNSPSTTARPTPCSTTTTSRESWAAISTSSRVHRVFIARVVIRSRSCSSAA